MLSNCGTDGFKFESPLDSKEIKLVNPKGYQPWIFIEMNEWWLVGITNSMDMSLSKLQKMVKDSLVCCSPWGHKQSDMTEGLNNKIHWQDWCWSWSWSSNTLATWCKESIIGKDPDAGKDWRQEKKGTTEDEMLDGITDSVDMSLSKLLETVKDGKPGVLQSMELQRVGYDWATEPQQTVQHAKLPQSCPTQYNPMDCSLPAPLSMGFPRQENLSGLPCFPLGIFQTQRLNPHL